tara:strand:- start:260 stop:874 length:615 start_codon:yes stop_codon:yes gene_type:complete
MKVNYILFTINILILVIIFIIYRKNKYQYGLVPVISKIDKKKYLVRDEIDKNIAASLLSEINNDIKIFINKLVKQYPNDKPIMRLYKNFKPNRIHETPKNSLFTSYSVNKGKHLYLCIRDKKTNEFEDYNILLYVVSHELAHIMSESIGHTPEFWSNFKFLLKKAIEYKLYKYTNYTNKPTKYCGLNITNNVLNADINFLKDFK